MGGQDTPSYDATRRLTNRPPNWGLLDPADVRVDVTHVERTGAVLTLALDGDTVTAARFKSRGVGDDRILLLARCIRALEGQTLQAMSVWQLRQLAEAAGVWPVKPGSDQTVVGLALLALRNAIDVVGRGAGSPNGRVTGGPAVIAADTDESDAATTTICYCMDVSEATILDAIRNRGATTVEQITAKTGAVGGCGTCRPDVQAILQREGVVAQPDDPTAPYRQAGGPPWVTERTDD